jgi:hypothetical protein
LRLPLPRESFSAYVAKGGFHRVGLSASRRPVRPGFAIATTLLGLTRAATRTLTLTATRAAGARATGAPSSAPAAVLAHGRRLQIIGFRRLAGISIEQLRLYRRA